MPDSSSEVGISKRNHNKIPKSSSEHDPKLTPTPQASPSQLPKQLPPPTTTQGQDLGDIMRKLPPPPSGPAPSPPPPKASPKAESLSWAQRLVGSSSTSAEHPISAPRERALISSTSSIAVQKQHNENMFVKQVDMCISEKLKSEHKVTLYFNLVDGPSLYNFLDGFECENDNIEVSLPKHGKKASITIKHRVEDTVKKLEDTVKKLIEKIAKTTFETSDGISGCCYIDGDSREKYRLPNQDGVSESTVSESTIECKDKGKTNVRRLSGMLNRKFSGASR